MEILVGCDPEVFVKKGRSFHSAYGLIPGTKEEPFKVDNGAVQVDGCALEFNIDPARTEDEFVRNVTSVMAQLQAMIPKGLEIVTVPTANFPLKHFESLPEAAKELGCEPDFSAYKDGAENPRPDNRTTMRTAAGHIHLGWASGEDPKDPVHIQRCCTLVKHLDAYLGIPSLFWDEDKQRRSMYGKAGAFRSKSYGVEYRTLSNQWLSSEALMRYVYRQSVKAIKALMEGERFTDDDYRRFSNTINQSSKAHADLYFQPVRGVLNRLERPPVEMKKAA